jgi:signal transduction histidine kinase
MDNPPEGNVHHFGIHASIIFQLGESLISDSVQALVELIKNTYDADSDYARVTIETSKKNEVEGSRYPDARGYIRIEDNGTGMNLETIKTGWLTISNSQKREMKARSERTPKGRTPLGDKGLGRMGAQRLGHNLEIFTKPENEDVEYHVAFSWKDFENKSRLEEVPIHINKIIPSSRKKGTTLLISDIKEPNSLEGESAEREFQNRLSALISPYKEIKDFTIYLNVDGKFLNLIELNENILNGSQIRYFINFDGKILNIKGKARLSFIRPQSQKGRSIFRQMVEMDNGRGFYNYLSKKPIAGSINLVFSGAEGWFVEFGQIHPFDNLASLELVEKGNGKGEKANPGMFQGRIDSFDLGKEGFAGQSVFDIPSKYRKYIKDHNGIKVYRDGFGIRVDKDWLGLGKQWTSGRSYYGLKVENTLGYIALSPKDNKMLEETTDREGFKVSPYYNNFFLILQKFVNFSGQVQGFLRRGWLEFLRDHQEEAAEIEKGTTPEELAARIRNGLSRAYEYRHSTEDLKNLLNQEASGIHQSMTQSVEHLPPDIERRSELKNSLKLLKGVIGKAADIVTGIDRYLDEISELEPIERVLENRVTHLREQLEQLYEVASLGLTAESLSHEIYTIADRLAKHAGEIHSYLKSQHKKDPKIISFVEHVDTGISALRKQMSHLAPSLKYVREKRGKIDIYPFCRENAYYHRDNLKKNGIEVQITPQNAQYFHVYMNPGKLTQIFDNLFLNSGYWLREDIRTQNIRRGRITIVIDKPFVRFFDNGRGVDPSVETTLFEPFVTTKGKGKGRGLGLFIVQQLLDSEGCSITLLPKRNEHHRLYTFEINFSGGLDEK